MGRDRQCGLLEGCADAAVPQFGSEPRAANAAIKSDVRFLAEAINRNDVLRGITYKPVLVGQQILLIWNHDQIDWSMIRLSRIIIKVHCHSKVVTTSLQNPG